MSPIRNLRLTMIQPHRILFLIATVFAATSISGCSHTDSAIKWSSAAAPPSGEEFSNGMPPSTNGPPPSWYAKRFNRERGLGEAIKQDHHALWDRDSGTFVYYVGGQLYAQYHPWEHYLQIRTDDHEDHNVICHWDADGVLSISEQDGGTASPGSDATCKQLLDELEKYVAPSGFVAHKNNS